MIEMLTTQQFRDQIFDFQSGKDWEYDHDTPAILNFFATWCGPCHIFHPALEEISEQYAGRVKVYKVDIDANPELPILFGVRSVPTTMFLRRGEEPAAALGVIQTEGLKRAISDLLNIS